MYKQIKKNILYAPLVTCMIFMGSTIAQSQENNVDFKNKITELEQRISGLETLKIELQELKQSLEEKEKSVTVKQEKLDTEIKSLSSLQKTMSVREATPSTRWHIAGYADTSFEGVSGDANDSFVAGHFNPSFHFQFEDWILFESELEFETSGDGDAEIAVEYSQLNFLLHDNVTLVAGKFLSPVGQFQERLHPSWINRAADKPAGFGHGGAQPGSDVGLMLRGGVSMADDFIFTYSLAVGNGPRFGHDADEIELKGIGGDNDSNKSVGGRLAIVHSSSLEFGVSYLKAGLNAESFIHIDGDIVPTQNSDYHLWGADFAYSKGPWDIRGEYLNSKSTPTAVIPNGAEPANWKAWYTQVAYRLSKISDDQILSKIEPVVRYGEFKVRVDDMLEFNSEKRWNVGVNYWAAPTIVVKVGIERNNYILTERADETRYQLQLAYGF